MLGNFYVILCKIQGFCHIFKCLSSTFINEIHKKVLVGHKTLYLQNKTHKEASCILFLNVTNFTYQYKLYHKFLVDIFNKLREFISREETSPSPNWMAAAFRIDCVLSIQARLSACVLSEIRSWFILSISSHFIK